LAAGGASHGPYFSHTHTHTGIHSGLPKTRKNDS
jgi:hypothetical protein